MGGGPPLRVSGCAAGYGDGSGRLPQPHTVAAGGFPVSRLGLGTRLCGLCWSGSCAAHRTRRQTIGAGEGPGRRGKAARPFDSRDRRHTGIRYAQPAVPKSRGGSRAETTVPSVDVSPRTPRSATCWSRYCSERPQAPACRTSLVPRPKRERPLAGQRGRPRGWECSSLRLPDDGEVSGRGWWWSCRCGLRGVRFGGAGRRGRGRGVGRRLPAERRLVRR